MENYCNASQFESWSEIYFTQLFTVLGQLSAVLISGTIAVPMINYYSNTFKFFKKD